MVISCTPRPRFTDLAKTPLPGPPYYVGMSWECIASYYGREFAGKKTSSGEVFYPESYSAAHPNLPFGTVLEVMNLENGKRCRVRINDRGPFIVGRHLDLSQAAAEQLGMVGKGTVKVRVTVLMLGE